MTASGACREMVAGDKTRHAPVVTRQLLSILSILALNGKRRFARFDCHDDRFQTKHFFYLFSA